jgi:hypothetical protein
MERQAASRDGAADTVRSKDGKPTALQTCAWVVNARISQVLGICTRGADFCSSRQPQGMP